MSLVADASFGTMWRGPCDNRPRRRAIERTTSKVANARSWPPRITRFRSIAGSQFTCSPRITYAPTGLARNPNPPPLPDCPSPRRRRLRSRPKPAFSPGRARVGRAANTQPLRNWPGHARPDSAVSRPGMGHSIHHFPGDSSRAGSEPSRDRGRYWPTAPCTLAWRHLAPPRTVGRGRYAPHARTPNGVRPGDGSQPRARPAAVL
jgi:hypothetical protein